LYKNGKKWYMAMGKRHICKLASEGGKGMIKIEKIK
jgi:hypothetical protein